LATFFLGPQPFGPPKMSLVLRPPVAWSLILRTGVAIELKLLFDTLKVKQQNMALKISS